MELGVCCRNRGWTRWGCRQGDRGRQDVKLTAMFVFLDENSSASLLIRNQCLVVTDNDKGQWIEEADVRAIDAGAALIWR